MKLGISLALAIAMHNIPEGISISIPLYYSTKSKMKSVFYTFVAGISEFFGAIVAYLFFINIDIDLFLNFLYLVIAGVMISLVIEELIPTAIKYLKYIQLFIWFLLGFVFMTFIKFLM